MRVHIRLLGGFDVTVDDRPIPAQVIDALWPDLLLDEAAPRLHVAAHYARTAWTPGTGWFSSEETWRSSRPRR